jgi:hypothetical protein
MKRPEFIAGTAALLDCPRRSRAQGTPRRIGSLGGFQNLPILKVFHEGLRDHGWIEGKKLIIATDSSRATLSAHRLSRLNSWPLGLICSSVGGNQVVDDSESGRVLICISCCAREFVGLPNAIELPCPHNSLQAQRTQSRLACCWLRGSSPAWRPWFASNSIPVAIAVLPIAGLPHLAGAKPTKPAKSQFGADAICLSVWVLTLPIDDDLDRSGFFGGRFGQGPAQSRQGIG